ncbi:MAG: Gfo/Idh/MocA family oxidoreductase [Rhodovibrionaceae bacterium]
MASRHRDGGMKVRIGVLGLGRAFLAMGSSFLDHPDVALAAAADPNPQARGRFDADFGLPVFETAEELCASDAVDALYIASPHQYHCEQVCLAAEHSKHVILEKPMALCLEDCDRMVAAAEKAGIVLVVGHTHAFDPPLLLARELIAAGRYGALRMIHLWTYTDFLYRPRRPEELDTELGGGIVFNQLPHQVDMIRHLGGGRLKSIAARLGAWDETRPTEGASAATFEFEDGCFGSMTYSGYAHFDTAEFTEGVGENGLPSSQQKHAETRKALTAFSDPEAEARYKQETGYAGRGLPPRDRAERHQNFGLLIATCDRADLRLLPKGVGVYSSAGFELLPARGGRGSGNRSGVIDELVDALRGHYSAVHDGRWAKATLEACLAILDSDKRGEAVHLRHQVALRERENIRKT